MGHHYAEALDINYDVLIRRAVILVFLPSFDYKSGI